MRFGYVVMILVLAAGAAGCRKDGAKKTPGDGGSVLLVGPDGAPIVGSALVLPPAAPGAASDSPELKCRVALRMDRWGPGGAMGGLQFKLRTYHARGTREQVLDFARRQLCAEDGVPAEQCTPELFLPDYEWCDGDPQPASKTSPEIQQLADRIRTGAQPATPDAGPAAPAADAAAPPADAPNAAPIIF